MNTLYVFTILNNTLKNTTSTVFNAILKDQISKVYLGSHKKWTKSAPKVYILSDLTMHGSADGDQTVIIRLFWLEIQLLWTPF